MNATLTANSSAEDWIGAGGFTHLTVPRGSQTTRSAERKLTGSHVCIDLWPEVYEATGTWTGIDHRVGRVIGAGWETHGETRAFSDGGSGWSADKQKNGSEAVFALDCASIKSDPNYKSTYRT